MNITIKDHQLSDYINFSYIHIILYIYIKFDRTDGIVSLQRSLRFYCICPSAQHCRFKNKMETNLATCKNINISINRPFKIHTDSRNEQPIIYAPYAHVLMFAYFPRGSLVYLL